MVSPQPEVGPSHLILMPRVVRRHLIVGPFSREEDATRTLVADVRYGCTSMTFTIVGIAGGIHAHS